MIDNRLRQLIQSEIEAIAPDRGDLTDVLRRGRRRQRTRYVTQTLGVAAVIGLIGVWGLIGTRGGRVLEVAAPEQPADLSLVVVDGDGPGEFAERLALPSGPPVVPGSATHLGSVTVEAGRLDIVSYRSVGGNPRFPNAEGTCDAVVSEDVDWGEAVCRYDPSEIDGIGYGRGDDGYTLFHDSPEGTVLVTVTTANGKTIDIETASTTNLVFALWETSWGPPEWADFKDVQGNVIERITFDDIETSPTTLTPTTTATPAPPVPTTVDYGDGLSDPSGISEAWLENATESGEILLLDSGVGIAVTRSPDGDRPELGMTDGTQWGAMAYFGPDHVAQDIPQLVVRIVMTKDGSDVTLYGIAPLGTERLDLVINSTASADVLSDQPTIVIDRIFQRPSINRAVFAQTIDGQVLLDNAPVSLEPWYSTGTEIDVALSEFETFGFQTARFPDAYVGPFTLEMFLPQVEMIIDSITVEEFPTVGTCQVPEGQQAPPNQVRTIAAGPIQATPQAALEEILTTGDLSVSRFFHNGYVELVDSAGNIAYSRPVIDGDLESPGVILINVAETEGGWTVTRWESSGC